MGVRDDTLRHRAGFSLVEMLIGIVVTSVLLCAVAVVQRRSTSASKVMQARALAESAARRALDRVAAELTGVEQSFNQPDPTGSFATSAMTYRHPIGVSNAGVVLWSTPSRLELQLDPRETNNGLDDDGDGLVDERRLVLIRGFGTAGAQTVVLCNGIPELMEGELPNAVDDNGDGVIDESGFNIHRLGDLLTVRLCVQQPYAGNQIAVSTLETSIVLHN
jgi:prepilin-type N-terminal cleavage/methylation domain-containing protein